MDALIHVDDWDRVEGYASALEDYIREESLAWTDFCIAQVRAVFLPSALLRLPFVLSLLPHSGERVLTFTTDWGN